MHPAPKLPENELLLMTVETNTKKATKFWLAILFQDHIKNKLEGHYILEPLLLWLHDASNSLME